MFVYWVVWAVQQTRVRCLTCDMCNNVEVSNAFHRVRSCAGRAICTKCVSTCLYLCIYLCIYLHLFLSIYLHLYPSIYRSIDLYLSIYLIVYLRISLCLYLFIYHSHDVLCGRAVRQVRKRAFSFRMRKRAFSICQRCLRSLSPQELLWREIFFKKCELVDEQWHQQSNNVDRKRNNHI